MSTDRLTKHMCDEFLKGSMPRFDSKLLIFASTEVLVSYIMVLANEILNVEQCSGMKLTVSNASCIFRSRRNIAESLLSRIIQFQYFWYKIQEAKRLRFW